MRLGRPARPAEADRGDGRQRPAGRGLQAGRARPASPSTRRTSCSSAAGPSAAWRRSSPGGWAGVRPSGSGRPPRRRRMRRNPLRHVLPEDLERFGLIPELLGRLPVIATLDDLGVEDLVRILREPKNSLIGQYQEAAGLPPRRAGVHRGGIPGGRQGRIRAGNRGQGAAGGRRGGAGARPVRPAAVGDLPGRPRRRSGAGRSRSPTSSASRRHPWSRRARPPRCVTDWGGSRPGGREGRGRGLRLSRAPHRLSRWPSTR